MSLEPQTTGYTNVQDTPAMPWWKDKFWIFLAGAIIVTSVSLGLILYCVCRRLFRQGKKLKTAKPLKQNEDEEMTYENVLNQSPGKLPPLPPRDLPSLEDASPADTQSEPPAAYSSIHKVKKAKRVSIPSYIEPEDDYDDVEIPTTTGKHHIKTKVSHF
ncbi:SLP adapter and CSK-interacting membrane protein isoform X1 [Trichechus manatus latirostris]|uniref:SLP adapter and CSK-interacting membrane protein isoform X1 n=1 Tax=Trichechus manatus latirostris TaxID=127582 RepID=A0A2Y9QU37_TRIMA|nr:SLP adapter and CSK-interacting membrane protein isoform X1 [Trichechus manatus latirostris]